MEFLKKLGLILICFAVAAVASNKLELEGLGRIMCYLLAGYISYNIIKGGN